jgi:hypothetical protein
MKVSALRSKYIFLSNFEIILNNVNQVNSHFVTSEFKMHFYSVLISQKEPYTSLTVTHSNLFQAGFL